MAAEFGEGAGEQVVFAQLTGELNGQRERTETLGIAHRPTSRTVDQKGLGVEPLIMDFTGE